ncbi:MAG: winged helix-turn-helix domain-containing protein [Candidatus Sulfotelmatobacter sp.]
MPGDVLRFGDDLELDRGAYELRRAGRALKLERIPMEILLLLVERRGQLVSREDIIEEVWGKDVHLDADNSINAAIRKIRQTLKDDPEKPVFVQTVTGKGYRFIAPVGLVAEEVRDPILANRSRGNGTYGQNPYGDRRFGFTPEGSSLVVAPPISPKPTSPQEDAIGFPARDNGTARPVVQEPAQAPHVKRSLSVRVLIALVFCVVVTLVAARFRPLARPPQVKRIRQLTHVGMVINNQNLLVAGSRIYFVDNEKGENQIRYVSVDGETVSPVEKPFPATELFDVLPSGNELLVGEDVHGFPVTEWRRAIWRFPVPTGPPRRVGNLFANDCAWSPDGRTIAYTNGPDLSLVDSDGNNARKLTSFPGVPFKPRWSPDGKLIRISVMDPKGTGISLWQLDASGQNVIRMLPGWGSTTRAWSGRWTRDGRYFLFTASQGGKRNVWALRDKRDVLHRDGTQPVQLTDGPLDFYLPAPSNDGMTIYAVGTQWHGQLMRYNEKARQFEPYAEGLSAEHVTFSRDGKWMAYVTYPGGELTRSRLDGSERLQLTFAPMRAYDPRWSPDGLQIAFHGTANVGAVGKVYLVSASGGSPRLALPGASAEQVLTDWYPDGQSLLIASSDESAPGQALYELNLKTGTETVLPGALAMSYGRVSPDGRYVACTSAVGENLWLYDVATGTSRQLADFADSPSWSPDGKYIYYSTFALGFLISPERTGIFRVKVADGSIERVAPFPPFVLAGGWIVLTPDGSPLVLRQLGTSDIYALDTDLP